MFTVVNHSTFKSFVLITDFEFFLLLVCMWVSERERVYYQHNWNTNNSKKLKFGTFTNHHLQMLLETSYEDRAITLCTETHIIIRIHCGLQVKFVFVYFSIFWLKWNEMKWMYSRSKTKRKSKHPYLFQYKLS